MTYLLALKISSRVSLSILGNSSNSLSFFSLVAMETEPSHSSFSSVWFKNKTRKLLWRFTSYTDIKANLLSSEKFVSLFVGCWGVSLLVLGDFHFPVQTSISLSFEKEGEHYFICLLLMTITNNPNGAPQDLFWKTWFAHNTNAIASSSTKLSFKFYAGSLIQWLLFSTAAPPTTLGLNKLTNTMRAVRLAQWFLSMPFTSVHPGSSPDRSLACGLGFSLPAWLCYFPTLFQYLPSQFPVWFISWYLIQLLIFNTPYSLLLVFNTICNMLVPPHLCWVVQPVVRPWSLSDSSFLAPVASAMSADQSCPCCLRTQRGSCLVSWLSLGKP